MTDPVIVETKLHRPGLPRQMVKRERALALLDEAAEQGRNLIVVSAPAGFGKTVCVADWIAGRSGLDTAWLSLDALDNEPVRFLHLLTTALSRIDRQIGGRLLENLAAGIVPPPSSAAAEIINDIMFSSRRVAIVLDDLQLISNEKTLAVLVELMESAHSELEIIIISRETPPIPLSRYRAHNRLAEVDSRLLRFDREESLRFLENSSVPGLTGQSAELLLQKTEGWIVGLQLALLSLRDREDPATFISGLNGSQSHIFQYLTEQILDHLSPEVRHFLSAASILESFCAELCNAVTGKENGREMLRELEVLNVFLIPMDDSGEWYRFHHLFADLLRASQKETDARKTREMHRAAACWLIERNLIIDALGHAMKGEDFPTVIRWLEKYAFELVMEGSTWTIRGFVDSLPDDRQPLICRTNLALTWSALLNGEYDKARRYLNVYLNASNQPGEAVPEWLIIKSLLTSDGEESLRYAKAAEALLGNGDTDEGKLHSLAVYTLASAYADTGNSRLAVKTYRRAMDMGGLSGAFGVETMACGALGSCLIERGNLNRAYEAASCLIQKVEQTMTPPPCFGIVYGLAAEVEFYRMDLSRARSHWEEAHRLCSSGGYRSGIIGTCLGLARISRISGDQEAADRYLWEASAASQEWTPEYIRIDLVLETILLQLSRGETAGSAELLEEEGFPPDNPAGWEPVSPDIPETRLKLITGLLRYCLVMREKGRLPQREKVLKYAEICLEAAEYKRKRLLEIEFLLSIACLRDAPDTGIAEAAVRDILTAISISAEEKIISLYAEQGERLFRYFSRLQTRNSLTLPEAEFVQQIPGFTKPVLKVSPEVTSLLPAGQRFTGREKDVIRLMSRGLKYDEIADALFVSINTVRFHVKSIYGKLDVSNRTQALLKLTSLPIKD